MAVFAGDSFPQGWPLGGIAGPGSRAVEEPPTHRLPVPAPPRRFVTIGAGVAALERAHHNLRRALAGPVAEHLQRAAELLRQRPSADMLLLGAARTAEVIDALDLGAHQLGAALPGEVAASADRLRAWARTLKQQEQEQAEDGMEEAGRGRNRRA